MPGVPQTLPVPPLVNEMTMLNAIRLAAGSGGGGGATGDVVGPASSTNGAIALWNGATGKLLQDSSIFITGGGTVALGGFTLTVPATGTAALLGTAQTFSAAQTFGSTVEIPNDTYFGRPASSVGFIMKDYASQINMLLGAANYTAFTLNHVEFGQTLGNFRITTDGSYIMSLRWDANANTLRVYGTYTDASNYERLSFITAAGAYSIKPEAAGTGTLRTLEISGLPTSSAGLASGTLWNNLGIVNVA